MSEKPTYEELEQGIRELESEVIWLRDESKRESIYQKFFNTAREPVGIADLDGDITYANQGLCDILGEKDLLGRNLREYFTDEDLPALENRILPDVIEKGHQIVEMPLKSVDGKIHTVRQSIFRIDDENGNPQYFANVISDISKHKEEEARLEFLVKQRTIDLEEINKELQQEIIRHKKAEKELRESEDRFSKAFHANPNPVLITTLKEGRIIDVNESFLRALGYPREETIGFKSTELKLWSDPEERKRVVRIMRSGTRASLPEAKIMSKSGETRVMMIEFEKIEIKGEECLISTSNDITERVQAEKTLRESEARQSLILGSLPMAFYIAQPFYDYGCTWVSEQIDRISGFTEEEFLADIHLWASRLHPEDRDRVFAELDNLQGKNEIRIEYRWHTADGRYIWLQDSAVIVRDENGRPKEIIGTRLDITERILAREQNERLEEQLRQAQKMEAIGTLAGGIAHDFNNILAAIIGYTEIVMLHVDDSNERLKETCKKVLKASDRAKSLVAQILSFSRSGAEEKRPIKIAPIIKEVLKLLRASLPTTIEIRQHISDNAGDVEADPTRIHQILMNLCTNAHHAMRERGGILDVSLVPVELGTDEGITFHDLNPGPYMRLTVRDTGCGMDQVTLGRIFEPYFTTKDKGEGTGLGLSVVHGIVRSYHGNISVQSEPGKGSTFHVYLPRVEYTKKELDTDEAESLPTGHESILFIDDEQTLVDIGRQILEYLEYDVVTMRSSLDALALFKRQPNRFDLIITDTTMPNMTGIDLAKALLSIKPDIPIILCTGFSESINEKVIKESGIREFVMKPLTMRDLARTVRKVLDVK